MSVEKVEDLKQIRAIIAMLMGFIQGAAPDHPQTVTMLNLAADAWDGLTQTHIGDKQLAPRWKRR
jgi:hypothetical protein